MEKIKRVQLENNFEEEKKLDKFMNATFDTLKNSSDCDYSQIKTIEQCYQCSDVASYIHNLLTKIGKHPRYLTIGGERRKTKYGSDSVSIKQIVYPQREWGKHIVVIDENNLVYDPALDSKPISKDKYFEKMFGKSAEEIKHKISDKIIFGAIKY